MFSWDTVTEVASNSSRVLTDNFMRGALSAALIEVNLNEWPEVLVDAIVYTIGERAWDAKPIMTELVKQLQERTPEAEARVAKRLERAAEADQLLKDAGFSPEQRQMIEDAYLVG